MGLIEEGILGMVTGVWWIGWDGRDYQYIWRRDGRLMWMVWAKKKAVVRMWLFLVFCNRHEVVVVKKYILDPWWRKRK